MNTEKRFHRLTQDLAGEEGLTLPDEGRRRFGSTALKVDGSIFAMLVSDQLVVKLPAERVAALIADGSGEPFASGKSTPMREWVVVSAQDPDTWASLAREALAFVRG